MIVEFSVKNYRSIREKQTISFEPLKDKTLSQYYIAEISDKANGKKPLQLLKIGILYGANASGKSNFLDAISYFKKLALATSNDKNKELDFKPFALDYEKPSEFEIIFVHNGTKYSYSITYCKKCVIGETMYEFSTVSTERKKLVYTRNTDTKTQMIELSFGNECKISTDVKKYLEMFTLWNETILSCYSKISAYIPPLNDMNDWIVNYLSTPINPGMPLSDYTDSLLQEGQISKRDVLKLLQNADFNISDFEIAKNGKNLSNIYFIHNSEDQDFTLPKEDESSGTMRFYGMAGILYNLCSKSMFMSIDELESSLHPALCKSFLLTFLQSQKQSQLLIATHNTELLQDKEILRKDTLWITDKNSDASTELYSFADFDSSVLRKSTSYYNAYSCGKLGGIPSPSNDLMFYTEE